MDILLIIIIAAVSSFISLVFNLGIKYFFDTETDKKKTLREIKIKVYSEVSAYINSQQIHKDTNLGTKMFLENNIFEEAEKKLMGFKNSVKEDNEKGQQLIKETEELLENTKNETNKMLAEIELKTTLARVLAPARMIADQELDDALRDFFDLVVLSRNKEQSVDMRKSVHEREIKKVLQIERLMKKEIKS